MLAMYLGQDPLGVRGRHQHPQWRVQWVRTHCRLLQGSPGEVRVPSGVRAVSYEGTERGENKNQNFDLSNHHLSHPIRKFPFLNSSKSEICSEIFLWQICSEVKPEPPLRGRFVGWNQINIQIQSTAGTKISILWKSALLGTISSFNDLDEVSYQQSRNYSAGFSLSRSCNYIRIRAENRIWLAG